MTIGRNDLCPCGSGKKYKKCCGPQEGVISLQAVREERNHLELLDNLLQFAGALPLEEGMADGVLRYFGGEPPEEPTDEEHMEPMDWILFGYRSPATGTSLCARLIRETAELTDPERELAQNWVDGAIPGFFHVTAVDRRELQLRRIADTEESYVVATNGQGWDVGELVGAWLLPSPSGLRFGCHLALLPEEAARPLEHLMRQELDLLRCQRPDASWHDLYREHWPRLIDCATAAAVFGKECLRIELPSGPAVQGAPQTRPTWVAVAKRFAEVVAAADGRAEEVAGGLRLWWDAVHVLQPRVSKVEPWVGALIYLLSNRVYESEETLGQIAMLVGSTAASVGSRAREIEAALAVRPGDARYADLLDPYIRSDRRRDLLAED